MKTFYEVLAAVLVLFSQCFVQSAAAEVSADAPIVAPAETIAIAKAAELAVHRIERLVTLKKIDPMFRDALVGLTAEVTAVSGASFKILGMTAPAVNGVNGRIELWLDAQGKTLSFNVVSAVVPAQPFPWPSKDASTLLEEGLHFVLEGWVTHAEVKAFETGLSSILLKPVTSAQGDLMAEFEVRSTLDSRLLMVSLKADGTFVSHVVK